MMIYTGYIRLLIIYSPWLTYHNVFIVVLVTFGFGHPSVSDRLYSKSMKKTVTLHPAIQLETDLLPDQFVTINCELISYFKPLNQKS